VIAERQGDGLLEGTAQGDQAPAMGEPVGCHGDDDTGQDAEQA